MSESRFMKTVPFGGYDRAGVEARFEQLSAQIFGLQNELADSKKLIETLQSGGSEFESLQQMLEEHRTKLTDLQAKEVTLTEKLQSAGAELSQKDQEIETLKNKIISLRDKLHERDMKLSAYEADTDKKPAHAAIAEVEEKARNIIHTAEKDAAKVEENSRMLAENIVEDANNSAKKIIYDAEVQSAKIIADAQNRSAEIEVASGNLRAYLLGDVEKLSAQLQTIQQAFDQMHRQNMQAVSNTAQILSSTDQILRSGGTPVFRAPEVVQPQLPPPPEIKPVPHEEIAPPAADAEEISPEAQRSAELAKLQQMANAIAGIGFEPPQQNTQASKPANHAVSNLAALAAQADAIADGRS